MTHYQLVADNKRKSALVVTGFVLFVTLVGYLIIYSFNLNASYLGFILILTGLGSFISYWNSDKIVLSVTAAKPANREQFFDFYTVTENLAMSQNLPKPKIYIIEDEQLNAFATGRNPQHAAVVATTGLLDKLNRSELEGVIAHELSHIKNYDILLMSLVTILLGSIIILIDLVQRRLFWGSFNRDHKENNSLSGILMIIIIIITPIIAKLIQFSISRRREFLADASAVAITKNPAGLIRALEKINTNNKSLKTANGATAHLFISDPFANKTKQPRNWMVNLFQTHPPIEKRIAALRKLMV